MDRAKALDKIRKLLAVWASVPTSPEGQSALALAKKKLEELGIPFEDLQIDDGPDPDMDSLDADILFWAQVYVHRTGKSLSPGRLAAAIEDSILRLLDREAVRIRGMFLGRCGTDVGRAQQLADMHAPHFAPDFIRGAQAAWQARLLGRHLDLRTLLGEVKPKHIVPGTGTYLSNPSGLVWARDAFAAGWHATHRWGDTILVEPMPGPLALGQSPLAGNRLIG